MVACACCPSLLKCCVVAAEIDFVWMVFFMVYIARWFFMPEEEVFPDFLGEWLS